MRTDQQGGWEDEAVLSRVHSGHLRAAIATEREGEQREGGTHGP